MADPNGYAPRPSAVTTEPIDSSEQVASAVDIYRRRWTIEEFFKALKTGCAYEKRQLEKREAFLNALAIFSAVAWRMLLLRWLSRSAPETQAPQALTEAQLAVLAALPSHFRLRLPANPSANDLLLAVAQLGGHIRNNGDPGWLVLGRGFDKLLAMEVGWLAAMAWIAATRCDQS